MTLTPAFLDELRARTSLSALIGRTTKLTRAGREMKGCCPFHNEKTPSFYVNDDKGFYHCFGCSAHGDAIRWLTDQRGLPFMDAVKELAQAAGMEMPAPDPRAAEQAERAKSLHDVMQAAADWFVRQLGGLEGAAARALLDRRGISDATARTFGFGFAPDARGKLRTALKEYGDAMLIEAGLLISVEGKEPYDRFRGRLMIPIRDPRGRVIAFGGRIIGEGEPKYLNSPDTPLFDKGRTLYNLDRALPAARKADRVFVVEGYMDAIALAQAGIGEVVAPLGTALTEAQFERLWRISDEPVLCFDGDAAGQKAAIRAAHRGLGLLAPGRRMAFAILPHGQDPDDIVQAGGASAFEKFASNPIMLDDFLWRSELATARVDTPDGRALLKQRLEQISQEIGHTDLQFQYKQALLRSYFKLFGIKRASVQAVRDAMAEADRHPRRELFYVLGRSVLLGLMRHPTVLKSAIEDVSRLPLRDRYLSDWQRHLINIAFEYVFLTESIIDQIIAQTDVSPIEARNYQRDLAFSFYRKSSTAAVAEADLRQVIEILIDEEETKAALKMAQDAFSREITAERLDEQTKLQQAAVASHARLSDWLEQARLSDENARANAA